MATARRPDAPVLSRAALNRALLARQHLLARTSEAAVEVVHGLVGLQAQNPSSPYTALWSRIEGFTHADLGDALLDRRAARIAVMRGTIHLVSAADAVLLPALTSPLYARDLRVNPQHAEHLRTLDLTEVTAHARALVEAEPRPATELGRLLAERWPHVPPSSLAHAARGTLPLVQVPPRGVWGRSGTTTWTTTHAWFGPDAHTRSADLADPDVLEVELERLVLRYLAAFGPASVADAQRWSGLTGLGPVLERLRERLVTFRAEPGPGSATGRELFDLPDAPRPDADIRAPVRFLPDYDNLLLSHADRTRLVSEEQRRALVTVNGVSPGVVLLDGRLSGTWRVSRTPVDGTSRRRLETATLEVAPLGPWPATARHEATAEAERLLAFLVEDAHERRVVVR